MEAAVREHAGGARGRARGGQSLALLLLRACSCPCTPGSCVLRLHVNQSSSCRHQTPQSIAWPLARRGGRVMGAVVCSSWPEHLPVCLHRREEAGVAESSLVSELCSVSASVVLDRHPPALPASLPPPPDVYSNYTETATNLYIVFGSNSMRR